MHFFSTGTLANTVNAKNKHSLSLYQAKLVILVAIWEAWNCFANSSPANVISWIVLFRLKGVTKQHSWKLHYNFEEIFAN